MSVYHQSSYRCIRRVREHVHDLKTIERCTNSRIATHILEEKVFELIQETMLSPINLRACCTEHGKASDGQSIARELVRVAAKLGAIDDERRHLINGYAQECIARGEYIEASRALDERQERLTKKKVKLAAALRSPQHEDFVDASIRQFCASANARFQACTDDDAKRQFLLDHIERVIYDHYKVTVTGTVSVQAASGETKLHFRITGAICKKEVRRKAWERGQQFQQRASVESWTLPYAAIPQTTV